MSLSNYPSTLTDGQLVYNLARDEFSQYALTSLRITPDGQHAISGYNGQYGKMAVWGLQTGQLVCTLHDGSRGGIFDAMGEVYDIRVTSDSRYAISGSDDPMLRIWDLQTRQCLYRLAWHERGVFAIAVTPDGRHVVSGAGDGTLRVWNLQTGQLVHTLTGHERGVFAIAITPDGRHVVSGAGDGTLRVWNLPDEQEQVASWGTGHKRSISVIAITPDGRHEQGSSYTPLPDMKSQYTL